MLARIRSLHIATHVLFIIILALFVWANLDVSCKPYNERIGDSWCGGIRCGFPLNCWDGGQATTARQVNGLLDLKMVPYGNVLWFGLAVNILAFGATLAAIAFCSEMLLARLFSTKVSTARSHRRMHVASYAAALAVTALLLWVNAQHQIQKVEHNGRTEFLQTRGWPLKAYLASRPYEAEFRNAKASALEMLAYLQATPNAAYHREHWDVQVIIWNLLICMVLIILAAAACEFFFKRKRTVPALA